MTVGAETDGDTMLGIAARLVACSLAVVLLAASAAMAVDNALTAEPAGSVTGVSVGNVSFAAGTMTAACSLTLGGTLEPGIYTTSGEEAGVISSARWTRRCTGSELEAVLSTPWRITYSSLLGTLPEALRGILFRINNVAFLVRGSLSCLYSGSVGALGAVTASDEEENTYELEQLRLLTTERLTLVSGGGCASTATMGGTLRLSTVQQVRPAQLGRLRAEPSPIIIPNNMTARQVTLRNVGQGDVNGADLFIAPAMAGAEAPFTIMGEGACANPITMGNACLATITEAVRPSNGTVIFRYRVGANILKTTSTDVEAQ